MQHQLPDLPCACAGARQTARLLTQLYDSHLRPAGIETPQFVLLMTLAQGRSLSQSEIGRIHSFDKTTVSRNLRLLEASGWIRSKIGTDRRVRVFALTPEGRRIAASAQEKWQQAQTRFRSAMTAAQWEEMFRVFRSVSAIAIQLRGQINESGESQ